MTFRVESILALLLHPASTFVLRRVSHRGGFLAVLLSHQYIGGSILVARNRAALVVQRRFVLGIGDPPGAPSVSTSARSIVNSIHSVERFIETFMEGPVNGFRQKKSLQANL